MTIYVLQMCDWEDQSIISVHSSREAAEEARLDWCMGEARSFGNRSGLNCEHFLSITQVNEHEVIP